MQYDTKWRDRQSGLMGCWAAVLFLACSVPLYAQISPHNPHVPDGPGPWFEGWYTRVSDPDTGGSVAVICASHLPQGQSYDPQVYLPGYLNVLISDGDGSPTRSYMQFPERTIRRMKGDLVRESSDFSAPAQFTWIADGFGTVTESAVDITLPGSVSVQIETSNRVPWRARAPEAGPEAGLALLPFPLHWHVHSLGSEAQYTVTEWADGATPRSASGQGFAHLEKNWQTEFPTGWVWAQGIAGDNQAQFVASVADVALARDISFEPWIVGYRSRRIQWDFRFSQPGTTASWGLYPCAGWFVLEARDAYRVLRLYAYAPPGTYGSVAVPTTTGFVADQGGESFSTTVLAVASVRVPLSGGGVREWPVDVRWFSQAALEFGNNYMCEQQR